MKEYRFLRKMINQIDSKNGRLVLLASFTAKFELIFALTQESTFLKDFILKPAERA